MFTSKLRKWILLAYLLLGIIVDFIYCKNVMSEFPEIEISKEQLLHDTEHNMIMDFEVTQDSKIISRSADPWIAWFVEKPVKVEEMNIVVNATSMEGGYGQIYLLESLDWMGYELHPGENKIKFYEEWREKEAVGFRFDLATKENVTVDIEKIIINEHSLLFWEIQGQALVIFLAVLALIFTFWAWEDFVAKRKNERYWIGGAISIGIRIGLYCNFVSKYFKENKQGDILKWYLFMMVILFIMEQLILRYYADKMSVAKAVTAEQESVEKVLTEDKPEGSPENEGQKIEDSEEEAALLQAMMKAENAETLREEIEGADEKNIEEQDVKNNRLKAVWDSLVLGGIFILSAFMNFAVIEILGGVQFDFLSITSIFFNVIIYLGILLVLYLIIRRPGIALIVSHVPVIILGLVNHYYFQFRGEPFEFASVIMADTAFSVLDNYKFNINDNLWFVILSEVLFLVIAISILCRNKVNFPKKVKLGLIAPVLLIGIIVSCNMPEVNYWSIAATSQSKGYLYSFFGYLKELGTPDEPEGYSVEKAEKVLKEYSAVEGENTPDVIVIMNEAFADLPDIYDFETDGTLIPFIDSMEENTIKGKVLVSVFGGTTCNSEYEFLTGNTMGFMPGGSVPFMQYIQEEQQSLGHLLKARGYKTTGYHAFYKSGFHRSMVYPLMGIDEFYGLEDEDTLPSNELFRLYMGDRANYKNVLYLYEKNPSDSSQFIFNVTMQNHGGYSEEKPLIEVTVQPKDEGMQTAQLQEYLSLVHESDDAFRELVEYYQNVEKDTIILMFGDHQPGLGEESYNKMDSRVMAEDATLEEKQKQYVSSFVMWANFDIEEQEDVFISTNYLRPFLLETAGMDLSSYDRFLLEVREKYPVINAFGYCDTEGNWHEIDEANDPLLQKYSWLQYYNVFDKENLQSKYYKE